MWAIQRRVGLLGELGLFLQLESEAKVRLRPLLARHVISLADLAGDGPF